MDHTPPLFPVDTIPLRVLPEITGFGCDVVGYLVTGTDSISVALRAVDDRIHIDYADWDGAPESEDYLTDALESLDKATVRVASDYYLVPVKDDECRDFELRNVATHGRSPDKDITYIAGIHFALGTV